MMKCGKCQGGDEWAVMYPVDGVQLCNACYHQTTRELARQRGFLVGLYFHFWWGDDEVELTKKCWLQSIPRVGDNFTVSDEIAGLDRRVGQRWDDIYQRCL